jgi:hypothetical protein
MSVEQTPYEEYDKVAEIPSILTNSAVEILEAFTTDIIEIRAESCIDETNGESLMREYGLQRKQTHRQSVKLDYTAITDNTTGEVQNPLTEAAVDNIVHEIGLRLDDMTVDAQPDLAVWKLVLNVRLPELERKTRALSDEFELTFVSDPAEDRGETRDPAALTRMKNRDRRLYSDLSFNVQNLNLRSVVETTAEYTEQGNSKIMGWGGPDDNRPNTAPGVADSVYNIIPEEYAWVKDYSITETNELVLTGLHDGDDPEPEETEEGRSE